METTPLDRKPNPRLTDTDRAIIAARARASKTEADIRAIAHDFGIQDRNVRDIALGAALRQERDRTRAVLTQLEADEVITTELLKCSAAVEELRAGVHPDRVRFTVLNLRGALEAALVRAAELGQGTRVAMPEGV